ncbi:hypothetical protein P8452_55373 [Trifolium repens]|nr:hypothetical protein P8452_55373 [Trifolium repens]
MRLKCLCSGDVGSDEGYRHVDLSVVCMLRNEEGQHRCGNVKQAINVLAMMIKEGVKPDVVTYNALMDGSSITIRVKLAADNGASVTVGDKGEEINVSN